MVKDRPTNSRILTLSRISDRSLAIELLETFTLNDTEISPPRPVDFLIFFPLPEGHVTALSLQFDSSVPSTAAHFKGRYFFARRSRCSRRLHEPANARAPLNRTTESARAEKIGAVRSPIPTSRASFSQRFPFASLRKEKKKKKKYECIPIDRSSRERRRSTRYSRGNA